MAEQHWTCSNCGSIRSRAISRGVVCANCGANFPNVAENPDITNQLTTLINTGKTEQIGNFRKNLRKELGNPLVNSANVLKWCDKLKEIYPEDYLAGFYTAYFTKEVGKAGYKKYLKDFDCRIDYEPNVFLKEAMEFAIKHVDVTTKELTNGFIEKVCEQVNSHLVEGQKKLNCEDFKKQVNGRLKQLDKDVDRVADIKRDVFICYVSDDLKIAKAVRVYLTKGENISCFLSDYNIPKTWTPGCTDYWERIKSQIKQANVFLVISSNKLEHSPDNDALKEIAFAKTQAHLARVEYKIDNSTEKLCERRTQTLKEFFDGKMWIKREDNDDKLADLALAVSSALEGVQPATNTEQRNTKPENVKQENVVKAEAVATSQPTNSAKQQESGKQKSAKTTVSAEQKSAKQNSAKPTESASSAQKQSDSLTHLEIPYGTTKIEDGSYKGNKEITSVTIPASVTEIGWSAFSGCSSLTSVTIPASVTEIGENAFYNCKSLTSINVAEGNKNYKAIDGNLYSKDGSTLVQYANGKTETNFTIPNSVTTIGGGAFSGCSSLTNVTIPNSVTAIGRYAFEWCVALTSVTIPNSVTEIGCGAFECCESLTSITIPTSVIAIAPSAFSNCTSLTSATIPNSVTAIGDYAFYNCAELTNATIPNSVTTIGNAAFDGCESLTSASIPTSVTAIGKFAFDGCTSLASVTIPNSVTAIGGSAFKNCTALKSVTIPTGVTEIGTFVFYECTALTIYAEAPSKPADWDSRWNPSKCPVVWGSSANSAQKRSDSSTHREIPETTREINHFNFNKAKVIVKFTSIFLIICTVLCAISFGGIGIYKSLTGLKYELKDDGSGYIIKSGFFYKPPKELIIPSEYKSKKVIEIEEGFLENKDIELLTSVTIPEGVTTIGDRAFWKCTYLTSISIPASVATIGDNAFYNCTALTNVTIPTSATKIGRSAFRNCTALTSVTIPSGVATIGEAAFYYCKSLTSIIIQDGVTTIGSSAFSDCAGLTSVMIPNSVTAIGNSAFWNCTALTSVTIPNSVTIIGNYAFNECTALTSVTFEAESKLTSIGDRAFNSCTSLTSVTIQASVTTIGDWAFENCIALTIYAEAPSQPAGWNSSWNPDPRPVVWEHNNIMINADYDYTIHNNEVYLTKYKGSNLDVVIPATIEGKAVVSVGTIFGHNTTIKSVQIPASVTEIGNWAFTDCTFLASVTFEAGSKLTTIGEYAFDGCSGLKSIAIPASVTIIGGSAFYNCKALTSITFEIESKLLSIGNDAFRGCIALTDITIPASVLSIGLAAFCCVEITADGKIVPSKLTNITVDSGNKNYKSIDGNLYSKDGSTLLQYAVGKTVTEFTIPASVTSIGSSAFYGSGSLTSVTIPASVTIIGSSAFEGCNSLTIYVMAASKPAGWNYDWNPDNRKVYWGY